MMEWLGVGELVVVWGNGIQGDDVGCVGVVGRVVVKCRWSLVGSKGQVIGIVGEMWEGVW